MTTEFMHLLQEVVLVSIITMIMEVYPVQPVIIRVNNVVETQITHAYLAIYQLIEYFQEITVSVLMATMIMAIKYAQFVIINALPAIILVKIALHVAIIEEPFLLVYVCQDSMMTELAWIASHVAFFVKVALMGLLVINVIPQIFEYLIITLNAFA